MAEQDTRPTPPSGMASMPPLDASDKLLRAIEEVRDEGRARDERNNARFERLEGKLDEVAAKTETNTKNIGEQADALTRVASAAAKAADLALEAKQQASKAADETRTIVESALRIHGTSIASTVDAAVTKVVAPIVQKVDALEKNDASMAITLANQDSQLALAVSLLAKIADWRKSWAFRIAFVIGGAIAGYLAAHGR